GDAVSRRNEIRRVAAVAVIDQRSGTGVVLEQKIGGRLRESADWGVTRVAGFIQETADVSGRRGNGIRPEMVHLGNLQPGRVAGGSVGQPVLDVDGVLENDFGPEVPVREKPALRIRTEHLAGCRISIVNPELSGPDIKIPEVNTQPARAVGGDAEGPIPLAV